MKSLHQILMTLALIVDLLVSHPVLVISVDFNWVA